MLASRQSLHCKTCGIVICRSGPYLDRFGIQRKKKKEKENPEEEEKEDVCVFRAEEEVFAFHFRGRGAPLKKKVTARTMPKAGTRN